MICKQMTIIIFCYNIKLMLIRLATIKIPAFFFKGLSYTELNSKIIFTSAKIFAVKYFTYN